jgi:hypothetical protein
MRIERADIEKRVDDFKYWFEQLRLDPERFRRYIMIVVASVATLVTLIVWVVRIMPSPPAPEAKAFTREYKTTQEWVAHATRQVQRDQRFSRVALSFSTDSVVVVGRVATNRDLAELRQVLLRSSPPAAVKWQVTAENAN